MTNENFAWCVPVVKQVLDEKKPTSVIRHQYAVKRLAITPRSCWKHHATSLPSFNVGTESIALRFTVVIVSAQHIAASYRQMTT
jgi:hypothetical protein